MQKVSRQGGSGIKYTTGLSLFQRSRVGDRPWDDMSSGPNKRNGVSGRPYLHLSDLQLRVSCHLATGEGTGGGEGR